MPDRGSEWVEVIDDAGNTVEAFDWKRCEVAGCPNFICARLSPVFCWPHSGSGPSLAELIEKVNEAERADHERMPEVAECK